jgi:hypothetical protein
MGSSQPRSTRQYNEPWHRTTPCFSRRRYQLRRMYAPTNLLMQKETKYDLEAILRSMFAGRLCTGGRSVASGGGGGGGKDGNSWHATFGLTKAVYIHNCSAAQTPHPPLLPSKFLKTLHPHCQRQPPPTPLNRRMKQVSNFSLNPLNSHLHRPLHLRRAPHLQPTAPPVDGLTMTLSLFSVTAPTLMPSLRFRGICASI